MLKSVCLQILYSFAIFLAPIKGLLIVLLLAIIFDTLFAIYKVWKNHGKDAIESHKMFNLVVKTLMYFGAVICLYLVDIHIFGPLFGVTYLCSKAMTLIFLFIEIKSIDETSQQIGNPSLWDIIAEFVKKIGKVKKDISDIQKPVE